MNGRPAQEVLIHSVCVFAGTTGDCNKIVNCSTRVSNFMNWLPCWECWLDLFTHLSLGLQMTYDQSYFYHASCLLEDQTALQLRLHASAIPGLCMHGTRRLVVREVRSAICQCSWFGMQKKYKSHQDRYRCHTILLCYMDLSI